MDYYVKRFSNIPAKLQKPPRKEWHHKGQTFPVHNKQRKRGETDPGLGTIHKRSGTTQGSFWLVSFRKLSVTQREIVKIASRQYA